MSAVLGPLFRHSEDGICPRNPSWIAGGREIPHDADSVRDGETGSVGDDENVGAPTFQVILEARLDVTNCQNGTVSEVIA